MRIISMLLTLFSLASAAHDTINAHFYHCRHKNFNVAFFHQVDGISPKATLSLEINKKKTKVANIVIDNKGSFLKILATIGSKQTTSMVLQLAKPPEPFPAQDGTIVTDYLQPFKSTLFITDTTSHNSYMVHCEVFGLSYDLFGDIAG